MAPAYATYPIPGASIMPVNSPTVMMPGYGIPAPNALPVYTTGHQPVSTVTTPAPAIKPLTPEVSNIKET